jgi:small conductance mechanosensitive channel
MEFNPDELMPLITTYGLKVLGAIVILIIGRLIAGIIRSGVERLLRKNNLDAAIVSFGGNLAYIIVWAGVILAALGQFGIETASFIAIMGAAGFAIGFALQGSLANFASGILLLVFRPFKEGDFVDVAGVTGVVKEMHLFNTILFTPDNVKVFVPNGQIYGNTIKNVTANDTRRIDLVIGIGYSSPMDKAKQIMEDIIAADERVLKDPAVTVAVAELADSSVNFVVRPWVATTDYWAVRFDITKKIKERFDEEGIEIPFPQRTVHMQKEG